MLAIDEIQINYKELTKIKHKYITDYFSELSAAFFVGSFIKKKLNDLIGERFIFVFVYFLIFFIINKNITEQREVIPNLRLNPTKR